MRQMMPAISISPSTIKGSDAAMYVPAGRHGVKLASPPCATLPLENRRASRDRPDQPISRVCLSFSAAGLPNGLSLSSSGLVSGTIAAGDGNAETFDPVITATDATAVDSETFAWNVNSPITLVPVGALQNNEGDVVSFSVKATDSTSGATLTLSATGLPNGLSL